MSLNKLIKIKEDTSPKFKIDWTDTKKVTRDAAIVGGAAAVAYMMSHLSGMNFGEASVWLIPAISIALNFAYKWLKDNSPTE